jgi:thiol-disulfide isomerase/thioredoxin
MRKRATFFLLAGIVAATGLWLARQGLSHKALAAVLSNPAPTAAAMDEFVATAADPITAVKELWATNRLVPRAFVLSYIHSHAARNDPLWNACRPIVLEAAHSLDSDFQSTALQILSERNDPEHIPTALAYLTSADSEVRLAGLSRLNARRDNAFAASFARLLADPDPQVQVIAAAALRNLTGVDFGTHLSSETTNIPGIAQWRDWWTAHRSEFPAALTAPSLHETPPAQAFAFELFDLQNHPVRLQDFKGKIVLLNFWATWCPSCEAELTTLRDLQAAHRDDLVVLGINIDGVSDSDDHDPPPTPAQLGATRAEIDKQLASAGVKHATLLDPTGKVLGPYAAGSLPTNVLIGADGTLRRRILGARTLATWEQLAAAAK